MIDDYDELIKSLQSNHLYPKKVVVMGEGGTVDSGLEVYCPPLQVDSRMEVCKRVAGEGYSVYHLPNNQTIYIEKMIK